MPETTITDLPNASTLTGAERVPMDQSGVTVDATTLAIAQTLPNATTSVAGKMSAADKTKLDGVASNATANSTDAQLRDRSTHTGTQAAGTITGLGTAALLDTGTTAGKVVALDGSARLPAVDGSLLTGIPGGATNLSYTAASRLLESSTGTDVTLPLATTSDAGLMASADKTKLDGVASGATANSTDAQLRDRSTHTGTQAGSTVTGAYTAAGMTMATARLLGRTTASSGAAEEISIGTGLSLSAGTLTATATGSGTKTLQRFTPRDNQPPASNFATLNTRNSIAVMEFDAATQESSTFVGVIPEGANLASGLLVRIWWMGATATSGNVRWGASFERTGTDLDADSFDSVTEVTSAANGTSGIETVAEITCTAIDSMAAGERFRLRVARIAADATNDTMTGDAQLVAVEVRGVA